MMEIDDGPALCEVVAAGEVADQVAVQPSDAKHPLSTPPAAVGGGVDDTAGRPHRQSPTPQRTGRIDGTSGASVRARASPAAIGPRSQSYLKSVGDTAKHPHWQSPPHRDGWIGGASGASSVSAGSGGAVEGMTLLEDKVGSAPAGVPQPLPPALTTLSGESALAVTFADGAVPDDEFPRTYESLNLDRRDTPRHRGRRCHLPAAAHRQVRRDARVQNRRQWVVLAVLGLLVGIIAFAINVCTGQIEKLKLRTLRAQLFRNTVANGTASGFTAGDPEIAELYFVFSAWDVGMVLVASALCRFFAPEARGSGIPEIKAFLNGLKKRGWLRLRTAVVKVVGIVLVVAATMPVGKEGPMVHAGAILGAGLPQFKSAELGLDFKVLRFRTDPIKHSFVAAGAAAGVACAFGAPIGGCLFAIEEGVSFLTQALIWQCLAACVCALLTLRLLEGAVNDKAADMSSLTLVTFGTFDNDIPLWTTADLFVFAVMGAVGGVLGALWCHLQKRLTQWRMRKAYSLSAQIWHTALIALANVSLRYVSAMTLGSCAAPTENSGPCGRPADIYAPDDDLLPFFCANETDYNDLGTILFSPLDTAIKVLIHSTQWFEYLSLVVGFVLLFASSCWTYGTLIPAGIFTPLLLTGALAGRLVGQFMSAHATYDVNVGMYALIGAAAFLGGCVRMTVSMAVILMEATNQIVLGPPLLVTLMIAKLTGDLFDGSIYDIHTALAKIPLLEWPTETNLVDANRLCVSDAMASPVVVCRPIERVDVVLNMLATRKHNGFPICVHGAADGGGYNHRLRGLILRADLVLMLKHRVWGKRVGDGVDQPELPDDARQQAYGPRRGNLSAAAVRRSDGEHVQNWMDLRPYMLDCPHTMPPFAPLGRAFHVFRTLGLRHLCVVEPDGVLVGLVTRHDLTEHAVDALNAELDAAERPDPIALHQD